MNNKAIIEKSLRYAENGHFEVLEDILILVKDLEMDGATVIPKQDKNQLERIIYDEGNFRLAREYSTRLRELSLLALKETNDERYIELYKATLLFDAPHNFDCFCRYIEWDRAAERKFYEPRRKQLKVVADALQGLEDDKYDLVCISLPPGVGKSTLALFYCIWVGCRNPEMQVLEGSHTADILRGIYDEMLRVLDPDGEYLVYDVFPDIFVSGQDAKRMRIDLLTHKRFQTFEFMAIGGSNSGKVRATKLLYCDDLIDGVETALNRDRLDKLWRTYTTDLQQRKQGAFCKELHIATRWSVSDVIGRLEEQYGNDPKAKIINISALDANLESNFDYPYGVGFSTEFYLKQKKSMDETDWNALYMGEPVERDGQLFPLGELNRYYSLPNREPDAVYAVVDTKDQGLDYCVAPIVFQYGMDSYIENFVCDNGKMEIVESKIVERFLKYGVNLAQFESNRAGGRSADLVESKIRERGGKTKVTKKWNQANKDTRIYVNSAWIKEHFWFKDDSVIKNDNEYRVALQLLERYTMVGSAKHRKDDVPDALSQLAEFVQQPMSSTIEVRKRPF